MKAGLAVIALLLGLYPSLRAQIAEPIIDGSNATTGEFPSMVAIIESDSTSNVEGFRCGGTLIHPRWILTAAHCFTGDDIIRPSRADDPRAYEILIGTTDLRTGGRRTPVLRLIIHPDYDPVNSDNDLALLLLAEDVTDIPTQAIVRENTLASQDPGTTATATGWGNTDPTTGAGNTASPTLRKVNLPITSLATANALPVYNGTLTTNMLPAGTLSLPADTCQGDSGGPLFVPDSFGALLQAGITSFGRSEDPNLQCGNTYGIYTRVSNYTAWIDTHITPRRFQFIQENSLLPLTEVDTDSDGFSDFEEFAFGTSPKSSTDVPAFFLSRQSFAFLRPTTSPQVTYSIETTPNLLSDWEDISTTRIQSLGELIDREGVGNGITFPDTSRNFYRVRTTATPTYEPLLPIPLTVPGTRTDILASSPTDLATATYLLEIPGKSIGSSIRIAARSTEFTPAISITNAITGEAITTSSFPGGRSFVSAAGTEYTITISGSSTGSYTISAFVPTSSQLTISPNQSRPGNLATTDAALPLPASSGTYRADTLALTNATTGTTYLATASSSASTIRVGIIEAESTTFLTGGLGSTTFTYNGLPTAIRISPDTSQPAPTGTIPYSINLAPVPQLIQGVPTTGTLTTNDPSNFFEIEGTSQEFYFDPFILPDLDPSSPIEVTISSTTFDPDLTIRSPLGNQVAFDTDSGPGDTSALITFIPPTAGDYTIIVSSETSLATGSYSVRFDPASTIRPGGFAPGTLTESDPSILLVNDQSEFNDIYDNFAFTNFTPGRTYTINLSSTGFDTFLTVYTSTLVPIASNNDISPSNKNSRLTFTPQEGIRYIITASSSTGELGTYTLQVSP